MVGWKNGITSVFVSQSPSTSAVSKAMMELGVAGGIGSVCVEKGIVTDDSVRILSKLTVQLLLPMLLSTSILSTFGKSNKKTMMIWTIPLIGIFHILVMFTISHQLFSASIEDGEDECYDWRRMVVGCSSFGNSAILPILMTQSFFAKSSPQFYEQCCSYISFYLIGWSPLFWSLGKSYMIPNNNNLKKSSSLIPTIPPPVMGVMAGIILGIITPIRQLLLPSSSSSNSIITILSMIGSSIYNCVRNFGLAAAPLSLLVLTCSLSLGQRQRQKQESSSLLWKQWRMVTFMRFVISPLVMWILLQTISSTILPSIKDDSALWFVLLLESCMPSAQNIVLLIQSSTTNTMMASQVAQLLYLIYITAMIPIPIIQSKILDHLDIQSSTP